MPGNLQNLHERDTGEKSARGEKKEKKNKEGAKKLKTKKEVPRSHSIEQHQGLAGPPLPNAGRDPLR